MTLQMFLYRSTENDDDGDPLDWGVFFATDRAHAATLIQARFQEIGLFGWEGGEIDVRIYGPEIVPTDPGTGIPTADYEITTVTLKGDAAAEQINPDTGKPWQEDDAHGAQCAMRVIASAECTCGKADALAEREY